MIWMMTGQIMSMTLVRNFNKAAVIDGGGIMGWLGNLLAIFALVLWSGTLIPLVMLMGAPGFERDLGAIITVIMVTCAPILLFSLLWWLDWQFCGTSAAGWSIAFTVICFGLCAWAKLPQMLWRRLYQG